MKVLLLAGEPSGDRWAAGVAQALRSARPTVELRAMGSSHLRDAGVPLVVDSTPLAVVGLTEVITHLPALLRARRALETTVLEWQPDVVVPVDYPDFNLRFATWARARGTKVAYFISPQVWAWRSGRLPAIGRAVSRMLVVFPFEVQLYERHGIPVEHVGHPLLDVADERPSREAARRELDVPAGARVVALLPGSRRKEVRRTWPVLAEAARGLIATHADVSFVLPLAPGLALEDLGGHAEGLPLRTLRGGAPTAIACCDVAAVASGTATLETALALRPLVVGYRVSPLTMLLSRRLANPEFLEAARFALPNLVLGRNVAPELYQERFTPEAVASELRRLLDDDGARRAMVDAFRELPERLGGAGAFARVATSVLDLASPR